MGTTKGYSRNDKEDPAAKSVLSKMRFNDAFNSDRERHREVWEQPMGVNMRLADEKDSRNRIALS